jgi:hypothetical protein
MKYLRISGVLAVCILAFGAWAILHGQNADSGLPGSTYLTTITDANTGAFSSRSLITLHADHSIAVVDSGQGGPGVQFSSQAGQWSTAPGAGLTARTLDFSFPSAGIARVDYTFTSINNQQVTGTITLTVFPLQGDPLDGGGTVVGTFNFTGQRVTTP